MGMHICPSIRNNPNLLLKFSQIRTFLVQSTIEIVVVNFRLARSLCVRASHSSVRGRVDGGGSGGDGGGFGSDGVGDTGDVDHHCRALGAGLRWGKMKLGKENDYESFSNSRYFRE
ncbi:hypothetical protein L484_004978 [Morus notabilis]|uniref:Uncharacterized protein n=1 Tax=Morus notabilis TaxID=981085 RepID=W9SEI9_9ROSA|nr:hypothetical protein L484_004978 [Morus notabilis]